MSGPGVGHFSEHPVSTCRHAANKSGSKTGGWIPMPCHATSTTGVAFRWHPTRDHKTKVNTSLSPILGSVGELAVC
eukprot:1625292-Prymnesium_polylepis.1